MKKIQEHKCVDNLGAKSYVSGKSIILIELEM